MVFMTGDFLNDCFLAVCLLGILMKKYHVVLSAAERKELSTLIRSGKHKARTITRARVLLKADASSAGPAWTDKQISQALDIGIRTIERLRKRLVEEGLNIALLGHPHRSRTPRRKLDGHQEAQLIAIVCSDPPEGRSRWTLRLLADQLVKLEVVESISHETVRQTLKKIN
jgi:transposase